MFSKVRSFVRTHVIDDVPDEIDACLDCGVVQCLDSRYDCCPHRLAQAAAACAARTGGGTNGAEALGPDGDQGQARNITSA